MFPRSLGQISQPCSTSILRFVFCTTASDLPVCFQTIAVHCWQSDYFKLSALLVCWLKIRQPSPFRQLGHNWVSQGWSAHLNTAPSLSSIPLFNTLQMKDFRSKAWKSWPFNNSLKKVSERVRQDGGVLSKLKNWMEKWKWFSVQVGTIAKNCYRYVVLISFRVCDCSDVVILLLIIVLKSKKLPPWFNQQSFKKQEVLSPAQSSFKF